MPDEPLQNPYESPVAVDNDCDAIERPYLVPSRNDLRHVARWQRMLIASAYVQLFGVLCLMMLPLLLLQGTGQSSRPYSNQHVVSDIIEFVAVTAVLAATVMGSIAVAQIAEDICMDRGHNSDYAFACAVPWVRLVNVRVQTGDRLFARSRYYRRTLWRRYQKHQVSRERQTLGINADLLGKSY